MSQLLSLNVLSWSCLLWPWGLCTCCTLYLEISYLPFHLLHFTCLSDFGPSCTCLEKSSLTSLTWSNFLVECSHSVICLSFMAVAVCIMFPVLPPPYIHALCHVALQFIPQSSSLTPWYWARPNNFLRQVKICGSESVPDLSLDIRRPGAFCLSLLSFCHCLLWH